MSRVLFAWELGANYGHLARNLPVAERLRDQGHAVSFAVCDLLNADQALTPAGFSFVPCPSLMRPLPLARPPINYSEILAEHGYADRTALSALVRAWSALLRAVAPDVVVSDFAPTALLAARVLSLRAEVIGPPVSVPPALSPLPSIRPWRRISDELLLAADRRIVRVVNDVLAELGRAPLEHIANLFEGVTPHLSSLPELDCYGPRTIANYIGPLIARTSHPRIEWQARAGKRVFAYLRSPVIGFEPLLSAIQQLGAQVICVIPDASASMIDRLRRTGINVRNTAVDLSGLLPTADAVVGYGSAGIIAESLMNGVPLLLAPLQVEHHLNAIKAEELGAAVLVDSPRTQARFRNALDSVLSEPRYRQAAQAFAQRYSSLDLNAAADSLACAIGRAATAGRA